MRYTGRIVAIGITLFFHMSLVLYYFFRDGIIETIDLLASPVMILVAYWAGNKFDKVKYLSEKDVLTGLYNRRFVMNSFDKITSLADRTSSKLFVLVIDCDNFKDINDLYGHNTGDKVLTLIGETLVGTTRKSDIVSRWGGDEFVVIGHFKEETGLQTLLQRLDDGLKTLSEQMNIPVKVSIGSAIYPIDSKDLFELIQSADENMYECKGTKKSLGKHEV